VKTITNFTYLFLYLSHAQSEIDRQMTESLTIANEGGEQTSKQLTFLPSSKGD